MIWGVFSSHCLGTLVRVPTFLYEFGTYSFWEIISIRLCGFVISTLMELSSKTTVPLKSPGWLLPDWKLIELGTVLASISQVVFVERFQKRAYSMPRRVKAIIQARGCPTRFQFYKSNISLSSILVQLGLERIPHSRSPRTEVFNPPPGAACDPS
ncbi:hypothetical protein TNCV_2259801 [Trichonephila clavipes]|nr:hypothetical protein TNCV_2259801 [Trichonephila clavipes]